MRQGKHNHFIARIATTTVNTTPGDHLIDTINVSDIHRLRIPIEGYSGLIIFFVKGLSNGC